MNQPAFWSHPSVAGYCLSPLSFLYWALACLRMKNISPQPLPVPVICVGNNTVGGTGKTPIVIYCCILLKTQGMNPHVISRGYKGEADETVRVDPEQHAASMVGDEPLLIARHAPCWVAKRRIDAASAAIQDGADCIIMDDGMQNPTIKKNLTLMVVDGAVGFGNKLMLPAGPCREPIEVSLHKSDAMIVMGDVSHKDVISLQSVYPNVFHAKMEPLVGAADWQDQKVVAFAGIGRPEKFFQTVRQLGAHLVATHAFADHHAYTEAEITRLQDEANASGAMLVTTQKDYVRLADSMRQHITPLPVQVAMDEAATFDEMVMQTVRGRA